MYRAKKKENPGVSWVLSPKLHRMFLCIFIITSLKKCLKILLKSHFCRFTWYSV